MRRAFALFYLLAASALVSRLVVNRLIGEDWGVDGRLLALATLVPLLQVPAILRLARRGIDGPAAGGEGDGMRATV